MSVQISRTLKIVSLAGIALSLVFILSKLSSKDTTGRVSGAPKVANEQTVTLLGIKSENDELGNHATLTETFRLPEQFPIQSGDVSEIQTFLESHRVTFQSESSLVIDRREQEFTVTNSETQLLLIEAILDYYRSLKTPQNESLRLKYEENEERLKTTIVSINFDKVPLKQVLESLSKSSASAGEEKLKIAIQVEQLFGLTDLGKTEISIQLENAPLSVALRYIAGMAQLQYRIDHEGVWLVQYHYGSRDTQTKAFHIPPFFEELLGHLEESIHDTADPFLDGFETRDRPPLISRMERFGIIFPLSSKALVTEDKRLLIVRNDIDQLELVEALIYSVAEQADYEWQMSRAQQLNQKLDRLSVRFSSEETMTLQEFTDIIHDVSIIQDQDPDLWNRGIKSHLIPIDLLDQDPFAQPFTPSVTLSGLKTFRGHLNEACRQTDYSYQVSPTGIVISPNKSE